MVREGEYYYLVWILSMHTAIITRLARMHMHSTGWYMYQEYELVVRICLRAHTVCIIRVVVVCLFSMHTLLVWILCIL